MKLNLIWDWTDFGFMIRIFKNNKIGDFYISFDIQFLWLNLWFEIFKRK